MLIMKRKREGHKKSSPDVSEELNILKVYCKAIIWLIDPRI